MNNEDTQEEELAPTTDAIEEVITDEAITEVNKIPVGRQLVLLAVILLLIFGTTITPKILALTQKADTGAATVELHNKKTLDATSVEVADTAFSDVTITAKAAYVWDIQNQKALYKKNEATSLPLASVTKLMTALLAQEILEPDDTVSIGELAIKQDGDSGLQEGEVFDRLGLSDLVLMSSSNDGAFALANTAGNKLISNGGAEAFVQAMNIRAKEIGLLETKFNNPTGLDIEDDKAGGYGSARDMAFLMEYIVKTAPDILAFTREDDARVYAQTGEQHDASNTNYYVDKISGLIGSKTGYTYLAGGNLVIAFNAGLQRPMAIVVLGSTQQERFTDVLKLVAETQKYVVAEGAQ